MRTSALVYATVSVCCLIAGGCANNAGTDTGPGHPGTSSGASSGSSSGGISGTSSGLSSSTSGGSSGGIVVGDGGSFSSTVCGNGHVDPGETCDDGIPPDQKTADAGWVDDGCTALCQIEANWTCPNPGQACTYQGICGNGVLTSNKVCDDGNTVSGDGCAGDCQSIEPGWECPVPGKACIPICGDGKVELNKACDDGNTTNGDGCSARCQVEPGWSCTGAPSVCVKSVCGNGILETGESCDCGTSLTKFPTGCTGPNGLFNGDGSGCSKTCTKEPVCRGTSGTGTTHACAATCGNGNLETGEGCDDGNLLDGDGCSSTCSVESGFTCTTQVNSDSQACTQSIYTGQCLELPVKYRDFENESVAGGHPDFFYYGATLATSVSIPTVQGQASPFVFNKRYCVPNSSGPARQNDSTARCWGMAQANLDNTGHPAFDTTRNGGGASATLCDCQFTDFSHDTNGGNVPGYTITNSPLNGLVYVSGSYGHPLYKGTAPVASSAASFAQWWNDSTYNPGGGHSIGNIELGPVAGQTNLYRFSSAPHSVYGGFFPLDPAANNFPVYTLTGSETGGPGTVTTSTSGNKEPLLCNLWPYWYSSATFGAGAGCKSNQYVFPPSFAPGVDPATWFGQNPNGGWITAAQGWFHDSWFSVEARYLFAFNGAFQLQFFGDDDTFVFINGVLVIDLGGVHQRLPASVKVDATGNATIQEGGNVYMPCTGTNCPPAPVAPLQVGDLIPCTGGADPITKVPFNSTCAAGNTTCDCRQRTITAATLGLTPGNTYEIAIFERDGHPTESNFQLTLSGFSTTESACTPRCGDGIVTGGEECDCGDGTVIVPANCPGPNNDTTYGGCTTTCTYGPYCGDGTTQSPPEQCDNGKNNGNYTIGQPGGCTLGCMTPHYCGDGIVDTNLGEQCDLGTALNGAPGQKCDSNCQIIIKVK